MRLEIRTHGRRRNGTAIFVRIATYRSATDRAEVDGVVIIVQIIVDVEVCSRRVRAESFLQRHILIFIGS